MAFANCVTLYSSVTNVHITLKSNNDNANGILCGGHSDTK